MYRLRAILCSLFVTMMMVCQANTADALNLYATSTAVRVRSAPTTNSKVVSQLSYRQAVTHLGKTGTFYKVKLPNGVIGYVYAPLLSQAVPAARVARSNGGGRRVAARTGAAVGEVSINSNTYKYHERSCRYYDCGACQPVSRAYAQANGVPCKVCH